MGFLSKSEESFDALLALWGCGQKQKSLLRPLRPLTKVPRRLYPAICFFLGCYKAVNRPRYYIQLSILMWIVGYAFFNKTSAPKAGQPNNAELWLKNWGLVSEKFHFSLRFDFHFLGYLWHLHFHHWLYLLLCSMFLYLIRHSNIFTLHMTTYWGVQSFCLGGSCQGLKYEDWSHCLTARKADSEEEGKGAKGTKKTNKTK
mmetsp:Transcript_14368/g.26440  ORF Transcript_14368/g.26440 Transcript_14368/m.26440 type:complete len:201 (+) Transcript_14368:304-906(+)